MWGTFLADVVIQMLGTDYARILRTIYALAQARYMSYSSSILSFARLTLCCAYLVILFKSTCDLRFIIFLNYR